MAKESATKQAKKTIKEPKAEGVDHFVVIFELCNALSAGMQISPTKGRFERRMKTLCLYVLG